tara:strand:- start:197 stop:415 length:219 start_codon:yes stop_codon:yes gene_type:complete
MPWPGQLFWITAMKLKRRITAKEYSEMFDGRQNLYWQCNLTKDYFLHTEFHSGNIIPARGTPWICTTAYKGD